MKLFSCSSCNNPVYFENTLCERCGHALGYEPQADRLLALDQDGDQWRPVMGKKGFLARRPAPLRYCANHAHGVCNWLLPAGSEDTLCRACRHNMVIPDLSDPANLELWRAMETAKHRLFHTILRLRLPLMTRADHKEGLGFEFLGEPTPGESERVMTGHDRGLITIALAEADDAERERRRTAMGEPYRTLLGHFRHETGHWYWDRLVRDGGRLEEFRALFGDEQADYGQALQAHYNSGPPAGWQDNFVSTYATSHPWEDWAESFAHYFHVIDTLDTGRQWGVRIAPPVDREGTLSSDMTLDPFDPALTIDQLMKAWLPLSAALNSFNRSMGHRDLYPFVLAPPVVEKLGFIHGLVTDHGRKQHGGS